MYFFFPLRILKKLDELYMILQRSGLMCFEMYNTGGEGFKRTRTQGRDETVYFMHLIIRRQRKNKTGPQLTSVAQCLT